MPDTDHGKPLGTPEAPVAVHETPLPQNPPPRAAAPLPAARPAPQAMPPNPGPAGATPPPAAGKAPAPLTPEQSWDLAKKQSKERRDLLKKHGDARRNAKSDAEVAALRDNQTKERFELDKKQVDERAKADPRGLLNTYNGLAMQEAVEALHADIEAVAKPLNVEVGPITTFGLEFDCFDPITGMLFSPAQAHRRDVGEIGILMTKDEFVSVVESARRHQKQSGITAYSSDRVA